MNPLSWRTQIATLWLVQVLNFVCVVQRLERMLVRAGDHEIDGPLEASARVQCALDVPKRRALDLA